MPNFSHVLLEKDASEHTAWLTITRPQRRNAINDLTIILTSQNYREGTSAIRESRKPLYEGR